MCFGIHIQLGEKKAELRHYDDLASVFVEILYAYLNRMRSQGRALDFFNVPSYIKITCNSPEGPGDGVYHV